jgi:hypothetical protein
VSPAIVALFDSSGAATARFAPPHAQPSFEDRAQAALDGTLIIDPKGTIRLFLLPDSAHFDPTFKGVRAELERLVPPPVVSIRAAATSAEVDVALEIAPGYHVMSDHPSEPTYIPTRITFDAAEGIAFSDARFPVPSPALFEGTVHVRVPVEKEPGARRVHGNVRYQACTASRCLFPTTRGFDVVVP